MKKLIKLLARKLIWLFFILITVSMLLVFSLNYINPPTWMWKVQRQWSPPDNFPSQTYHQWVTWQGISSQMKLAVIAAEDQLYPQHYGFDLESIWQAIRSNTQGKRIRGASTISQQTAKNLFLWPGKNLLRKGIEAWFTILMEILLDKKRILEIYLNIVEFGPGIFGVEAGSQQFYSKPAESLSRREAAQLAAVLPNPYRFHVQRPSAYVTQRTAWIEQQMRQLGLITIKNLQ